MTYDISTNATDQGVRTFLLVKLDFPAPTGTLYLTNCDIPIVTGSPARSDCAPAATWTPYPVSVTGVGSMQQGGFITLGNGNLAISQILFGATNPVGSPMHVWEAWFDPSKTSAAPDDSTQILEARLDQLRVKTTNGTDTAVLNIAPPIDFSTRVFPRRRFTQKCSFVYKSSGCQADGSDTSCDGTLTACSLATKRAGNPAGGNKANFGGFPMLPAMGL